jgi:hypothetical protein
MNERLLKKIILEEIRKVLNEQAGSETAPTEADERVAKSLGAVTKNAGEEPVVTKDPTNNILAAIGYIISMSNTPERKQRYAPIIQALKGMLANPQQPTQDKGALYALNAVKNDNNYSYYITLAKKSPDAAPATKQTSTPDNQQVAQSKEVQSPELGARNNPANDIFSLKRVAAGRPDVYKGKIGFWTLNGKLQSVQF